MVLSVPDLTLVVIHGGVQWGGPTTAPVAGDYNNDGRSDLAVYDTATGKWYIYDPFSGVIAMGIAWGTPDMRPVPGDYNGDGTWDLALTTVTAAPGTSWN